MQFGHFDDTNKEYVITDPENAPSLDQLSGHAMDFFSLDFQYLRRIQLL